jgi:hypothetical protein
MMELTLTKGMIVPEGFSQEEYVQNEAGVDIQHTINAGEVHEVRVISADVKGVVVEFKNGYRRIIN